MPPGAWPAQQPDQPGQLAALGPLPWAWATWCRPSNTASTRVAGRGDPRAEQLGGQPEVADIPRGRQDLLAGHAGDLGDRPGRHPLGHAQLDPGEVGRDLALAQQRHRRQQLGRGLGNSPASRPISASRPVDPSRSGASATTSYLMRRVRGGRAFLPVDPGGAGGGDIAVDGGADRGEEAVGADGVEQAVALQAVLADRP